MPRREFDAAALNAHAAALVLGFLEEVSDSGWDFSYLPDLGVSLALPLDLLGPAEAEEGGERRWTDDGTLTSSPIASSSDEAASWHAAARRGQRPAPRRSGRCGGDDLLVTERRAEGRAQVPHPLGPHRRRLGHGLSRRRAPARRAR